MLTPAFANLTAFFYPLGNTPAVSLTQAIPPNVPADILLLGCGDVRNILFTNHVDARSMDITCCDIQKAIIARNILVLSLIIDYGGQRDDSIWNIYYHFYLDKESLDLLRSQAKKLYEFSATMESWERNEYGSKLRFCDSATFAEARELWEFYSVERKGMELSRFESRLTSIIKEGLERKKGAVGGSSALVLTGSRSAIPTHLDAIEDIGQLHNHFWKYGTTEFDEKVLARTKYPNPMFLTLDGEASVHYATDPLLGFHLAAAYVPLHPTSPLFRQIKGLSRLEKVVAVARAEFREWSESYKKQAAAITLRFHTGDAVPFAHTLKNRQTEKADTANWYRDPNRLEPLVLDGTDYASGSAPLAFDVIDTSNLCDHVGPLILLAAASPLLRHTLSSTLYTELLKVSGTTLRDTLDSMLCGHVPTVSMLLGLFPVEYWTNTSSLSVGDEGIIEEAKRLFSDDGNIEESLAPGQLFLRTSWKRPLCMNGPTGACLGLMPIHFEPKELARVLYWIYLSMFENENIVAKLAKVDLKSILKGSIVFYHRVGYASFLRLVKTRVTCDWDTAMNLLIEVIETRPESPIGKNFYIEELFIYLQMLEIFSTDTLRKWQCRNSKDRELVYLYGSLRPPLDLIGKKLGDLRDWDNIPPVVCVTLKIPRDKLSVITNMDRSQVGTPYFHCIVHSPPTFLLWQNIFQGCQLTFGNISTSGQRHSDSFNVSVTRDSRGWSGNSPLIAAFYVPTYYLLMEPREATVTFGIHSTPQSTAVFIPQLGLSMSVYKTTVNDADSVYITRYGPSQQGLPVIPGFSPTDMTSPDLLNAGADTSLKAGVGESTGLITTLTGRLDLTSSIYKASLKAGHHVTQTIQSPCQMTISLNPHTPPLSLCFPAFMVESTQIRRIARKSSYIEVVVQVGTSSEWAQHPSYMYPVYLPHGTPLAWNAPYLNPDRSPIIDAAADAGRENGSNLAWLTSHLSLAFSAHESSLRKDPSLPRGPGEQLRLHYKESVLSILGRFAGVRRSGSQGNSHRRNVFALHSEGDGGVHVLILASRLRLDQASRSAALDCAVLVLRDDLMTVPRVPRFLGRLVERGLCQLRVGAAELRLWKAALPAFVERCRTWDHRGLECEYAWVGAVPLSLENGERCLCSCGDGKFPPDFVVDVDHWDDVSQYAVRAVISPPFWAPFDEDMCRPDRNGKEVHR
ncbi:hypothetical protein GGR54DRAFT_546929 [Hypoxylon sp. NC1633]|nr:hypothetical protein GGR54DRAFT_546929 [Hypoxylon sp. NC1633]